MVTHRLIDAQNDFEKTEEEVSFWARAVALKRSVIIGVSAAAVGFAVHQGWITPDVSDNIRGDIDWILAGVSTIGAGTWIHRGTTVADQNLQPVNSNGVRLVPDVSVTASLNEYQPDDDLVAAVDALKARDK
jgi:hypothetical protein